MKAGCNKIGQACRKPNWFDHWNKNSVFKSWWVDRSKLKESYSSFYKREGALPPPSHSNKNKMGGGAEAPACASYDWARNMSAERLICVESTFFSGSNLFSSPGAGERRNGEGKGRKKNLWLRLKLYHISSITESVMPPAFVDLMC